MRKIFIIYDTITYEVWEWHKTESECIERYNTMFDGFVNVDWIAVSVDVMFKKFMEGGSHNV